MKPLGAVVAVMLGATAAHAVPPQFGGEKTTWHGFYRYDFLLDVSDLSIKPHKALAIVELRRRRLTQARIAASLCPKAPSGGF